MRKVVWFERLGLLAAFATFGVAVYSLDLVASGFALKPRGQVPRFDVAGETDESHLFVLQYPLDKAMSWGELETRHSLSEALLEESFRCTVSGSATAAREIRKRQVPSLQTVFIVLRTGACRDGPPQDRRR